MKTKTVYRYETKDTPKATVYRTRESIVAMRCVALEATSREVPESEVTALGLWEPARVLVGNFT